MTLDIPPATKPTSTPFRKRTYAARELAGAVAHLVRLHPAGTRAWRADRLDPLLREQVMFAVAMANDCTFCSYVHNGAAIDEGADRDALARLVGLDPQTADDDRLIAVAWGQGRAAAGLGPAEDRLERELRARYTAQQVADLDTVVRLMTIVNLSGNTAEALLRRLRGDAVPGGRVLDEVLIGGGYLVGAVHLAVMLAARRRVSPLRVFREFSAFDGRSPSVAS